MTKIVIAFIATMLIACQNPPNENPKSPAVPSDVNPDQVNPGATEERGYWFEQNSLADNQSSAADVTLLDFTMETSLPIEILKFSLSSITVYGGEYFEPILDVRFNGATSGELVEQVRGTVGGSDDYIIAYEWQGTVSVEDFVDISVHCLNCDATMPADVSLVTEWSGELWIRDNPADSGWDQLIHDGFTQYIAF